MAVASRPPTKPSLLAIVLRNLVIPTTVSDRRALGKQYYLRKHDRMTAGLGDEAPLPWPLFTIDFEASSLEAGSYPIEVGICRWLSPEVAIEGWSTLIKPTEAWREHRPWSMHSEEVHGITRYQLESSMSAADTMAALNAIVGDAVAFCDGGASDLAWAHRLAMAAGVTSAFRLGDVDMLFGRCDQLGYMRLVQWFDRAPARHRARDDAEHLMKALARGLGLEHGTSVDIVVGKAPPSGGDTWKSAAS